MAECAVLLGLLICATPASAQSVQQSGQVTPGHIASWLTNGVIGDGGVPGGPIFTGSTTQNDFACVGAGSTPTIIDCGLSATAVNNWTALQNFNGGSSSLTRPFGDNTTNVATTAFVNAAFSGAPISGTPAANDIPVATSSTTAVWTTPTSWFDSAYCNTIGYMIVRLTGAWTCSQGNPANPVWWGADPTGSADSTAAFNSALAASAYVRFPPGKFKLNSAITYNVATAKAGVLIEGSGQEVTILYWPNANGGLTVHYPNLGGSTNQSNSALIKNFTATTSQVNSGNCITLSSATVDTNGAAFAPSTIRNVTCRGDDGYNITDYWAISFNIVNVSNVILDAVYAAGPGTAQANGYGVFAAGTLNGGGTACATYIVVIDIINSVFNTMNGGVVYGSCVNGLMVVNTNFTANNFGIFSASSEVNTPIPLTQLTVTNCQIGTATNGTGIHFGTAIDLVQITNNLFIPAGASSVGINAINYGRLTVVGNQFSHATGGSSMIVGGASVIDSNANATIANNIFLTPTTGVVLESDSLKSNVSSNNFIGAGTSVLDNSTAVNHNNVISNNIGYNPVGITAAANVGGVSATTPGVVTAGASSETHYVNQSATNTATISTGSGVSGANCTGQKIATLVGTTTYYTVQLGPNEAYCVAWTTTQPTYTKSVH